MSMKVTCLEVGKTMSRHNDIKREGERNQLENEQEQQLLRFHQFKTQHIKYASTCIVS